ncbi:arrestin homolog isoform X2 [Prorops nasuta]
MNNKLTLYLVSRDIIASESEIDNLYGVILVDPEYLKDRRVYGQVTLTFRYGREDEESMGLKFCNEAILCVAQLYPPYTSSEFQETIPLQEALVKRLGSCARAFTMKITSSAPPSVILVPAKEYNGAPIGTSYDVRAFIAERADEKLNVKTTVRMAIRVIQRSTLPPLPATTVYTVPNSTLLLSPVGSELQNEEEAGPHAAVEKPFILNGGRIRLEAKLDRSIYAHGDSIAVQVSVTNNSSRTVRRIKVLVFQHVDVCMFTNGKFKNVVAALSSQDGCPIVPGGSLKQTYSIKPVKSCTKNWVALEDSYTKAEAFLSSTIKCPGNSPEDRNVFAIYVSYYVQVKLIITAMGFPNGVVSLKLPFTLMHSNMDQNLVSPQLPMTEVASSTAECTGEPEVLEKPVNAISKTKGTKVEDTKRKKKERTIADMDLIEQYDETGST